MKTSARLITKGRTQTGGDAGTNGDVREMEGSRRAEGKRHTHVSRNYEMIYMIGVERLVNTSAETQPRTGTVSGVYNQA